MFDYEGISEIDKKMFEFTYDCVGNVYIKRYKDIPNMDTIVIPHYVYGIMPNAFSYCSHVKCIIATNKLNGSLDSCFENFQGYGLTLMNFDISNVSTMNKTFYNCPNLVAIDFHDQFKGESLLTMNETFANCPNLECVYFGHSFTGESLNSMSSTFSNCKSLTTVHFGNCFRPKNLKSIRRIFYKCSKLYNINFGSQFCVSALQNMAEAFLDCLYIAVIDFGNNVACDDDIDLTKAFENCCSLRVLILGDSFNCSVPHRDCFNACFGLRRIDAGKNFNLRVSPIDIRPKNPFASCNDLDNDYVLQYTNNLR